MKLKLFPILAIAIFVSSCSKNDEPTNFPDCSGNTRLTNIEIDYNKAVIKARPDDKDIEQYYNYVHNNPCEEEILVGDTRTFEETSCLEVEFDKKLYRLKIDSESAQMRMPIVKDGRVLIKDEKEPAYHNVMFFQSISHVDKHLTYKHSFKIPPYTFFELWAKFKTFAVEAPITVTVHFFDGPNKDQDIKMKGVWKGVVIADPKQYPPTLTHEEHEFSGH